MKTLLSTMTALVLSASLSSVASAQTLDPSMNPAMDPNQQWQDGQGVVLGWEKDGRLRLANQLGIQRLGAGEIIGLRSGE